MKSCMISLVLMSICCAQGQISYVGTGESIGQFQDRHGHYQGSEGSGVVSVRTFNINSYSRGSASTVTSSSGYNDNGTMYYRYILENTIGNTLYHFERWQWPSLTIVKEFRFRLDLSDPRATPVWD